MTQNATTQKSTAKSVVIVILLVLLAAACTLGFLAMNRAMKAEEQNAALEREKASMASSLLEAQTTAAQKVTEADEALSARAAALAEVEPLRSANGDLAGYLLKHNVLGTGKSLEYTVYQGAEARRPSVLKIRAEKKDGNYTILVGGSACLVAEGNWGE